MRSSESYIEKFKYWHDDAFYFDMKETVDVIVVFILLPLLHSSLGYFHQNLFDI